MSVNLTIGDLAQILQSYYTTHQAIYERQNDQTGYVFEDGVISAFEPVKVDVEFVSEGAGYSNLAGAITLSDLLSVENQDRTVLSLYQDQNIATENWTEMYQFDGAVEGILSPFFADNIDISGGFLDEGVASLENPTSITLLPGDSSLFYLATGYGHIPTRRADYLFSVDDVGSLLTDRLPPEGSYVKVTDNGDGTYTVAWEDLTGGGDRDFDDVVLKFSIERIPYYEQTATTEVPETASQFNTFAVQVGDAVVEAWYGTTDDGTSALWFKTTALNDLEGYTIAVTDADGNPLPNVGGSPYSIPALQAGESDIQYFAPISPEDNIRLVITAPEPQEAEAETEPTTPTTAAGTAIIEKRGIVGYDTKTITFGDKTTTFNIPVLDISSAVSLNFGKYERVMPNGQTVLATVPASVSGAAAGESVDGKYYELLSDNIAIEDPGKPVKPDKADFINPETGELDKDAYNAAVAEYKEALAAYKTAAKTYKSAVKAAKLVNKGQAKSLKIEQKAIKTVNKALAKLVKGEKKADKYITKAEVSLEKAANYREKAQQLRDELNKTLEAKGWTMDDVNEILANKPNKADFIDPATGELDKEAYDAAKATYKEAKAIAKLAKKADKYDVKADKLEAKAEAYQQKALDITAKTAEKFKTTLEKLISKYASKADSLGAAGESLVEKAQGLEGADMYKALGKGIYNLELSEGYARGAEIATAVLDAFVSVDASVTPDVAASLESVDISSVNVSI